MPKSAEIFGGHAEGLHPTINLSSRFTHLSSHGADVAMLLAEECIKLKIFWMGSGS
jgi:hypothetical protein